MFDLGQTLIAAAHRDPLATAVIDGSNRYSYEEWLNLCSAATQGLRRLGLVQGDRLLCLLQNRWEAAALHWACQLSGVVIVPINWRANAEEIDGFIEDAEPTVVAFEHATKEAVENASRPANLPRLYIDDDAPSGVTRFSELIADCPTTPMTLAEPDTLSVMFYTSGTTGRGKGVPRSHFAERAAAIAHVAQNCYRFGERTLGVMPLYHTMGVRSLLAMALVNGCFVCLPKFDAARALRLIEDERITSLYLVPTLYHDVLAHPTFKATDISSARKLGFAGAAMPDGLLARVNDAFKPDLFVNHYGSSEVYTFTICQDAVAKPGSAGKAGLNQEIRVIQIGSTRPDQIVGPDEEGQIIARLDGDEAFAGYWNRPDANAKSLVDGWYLTGDIGYQDQQGDLFVTGRVDDMIITGGENVLPAEIESVLSLHPSVDEIAVAGLPHERWGQQVTAFVKRKDTISADDLDAWCRQSELADFKRPRAYRFVTNIPKSPVGKILRRQLIAGNYTTETELKST